MKRSLACLFTLLPLLTAFATVVEDQSQSSFGTWGDLRQGGIQAELAQTFQPGIAGQLFSIAHSGLSPTGDPEYPTTFTIVDTTTNGLPGTNILGQSVITNISAQTTVYFTNQTVFLETNTTYAIIISTEAPVTPAVGDYAFRASFGDGYPQGTLWTRPPGGVWVPASSPADPSRPLDLVFATYMEPGIPDIRISQPAQNSIFPTGQSLTIAAIVSDAVTDAASVDFYASDFLLGSATSAPYSMNWTPTNAASVGLYAVLWKTGGGATTSAVQQITVTDPRPVNDDFSQRILLTGEVATGSINQTNATVESGEPRPFAVSAGKTLWWQWTAPRTAQATVVVTPAPQNSALLSLFTGSQLQSLYLLTNHAGILTQPVQAGMNYQISLDSVSNELSNASLSIALNDVEISNPAPQTVFHAPAIFSLQPNRTATARNLANIQAFANQSSLGSVGLDLGLVSCSIADPGFYDLQTAASDTNGVTTYSTPVPIIVRPANDDFNAAETIDGRSIGIHTSNLAATLEPLDPRWGDNQSGSSIWYRWTAPSDGMCVIDGAGMNFALLFNVCLPTTTTGPSNTVSSLSVVAANALGGLYEPVEFDAVGGTTYFISADGFFGEQGSLDWTLQLKPYNDDFASRRLLTGLSSQFEDSNAGATLETGETAQLPANAGSSVWYTWQAPVAGNVIVSAAGTNALALGIFQGDSISNLVMVSTNAGGWTNAPTATFTAEKGAYYQIGVFGEGASQGSFQFQITLQGLHLTSPLANTIVPFPTAIQLSAELDVPGKTLTNLTFKVNDAPVGTVTNAPFSMDWLASAAGSYTLSASGMAADGTLYDAPPITCLEYANKQMPRPRVFSGVGCNSSYVINAVGAAYVFGANAQQFGRPATNELSSPFLGAWPTGVTGWKEISSGWAISDSGDLYQNGTTLIPRPAGVTGWKTVSCGFDDVVTVSEDGDMYLGGTTLVDIPKPTGGWLDARASLTDVNNNILALGGDNQVYLISFAYGESQYSCTLLPAPAGVTGWKRIAQAALFSVLLTDHDELYIYGEYGGITGTSGTYGWSEVSRPAGVNRWVDFAAGGFHVLAIGDNAQLYGMGRNWELQLGLGQDQNTRATPTLVPLPPGVTGWEAVAAGQFHSLAIGNDCSLYGWGANDSGQSGQPSSASLSLPTRVGSLEALCGIPVIFTDGNASRLPDGSFKVEFSTDLNRAYLVQYSSDFITWKTANATIIGTGGLVQWIDNGPPLTDSNPGTNANRVYRVIYAP